MIKKLSELREKIERIDKRFLAGGGAAFVLIVCIIALNIALSSQKELKSARERQKEFVSLLDEFARLKYRVDIISGKKTSTAAKGVVQAVDEVFQSVGLKQRVKSVQPTNVRQLKDMSEEEAEVQIEKVDMNELVNILYKIENAPMYLSLRKTTAKTSFDTPSRLNVTLTLALIKPK